MHEGLAAVSRPPLTPPRPRGFERPVSLSEVLDRVLNKGVVVAGEVVITLADVDLVYIGLNLLVSSVETALKPGVPAAHACAVGWKPGVPAAHACAVGWKPGVPAAHACAVGWESSRRQETVDGTD